MELECTPMDGEAKVRRKKKKKKEKKDGGEVRSIFILFYFK